MSAANTVLEYEPEWEPPDDDELEEVSVDKRFQSKVNEYHVGLKSMSIKGIWQNEEDETLTQDVCRIKVKGGGTNKIPAIDKYTLAKIVTARCSQHAEEKKAVVKYKVTFYGDNEDLGGTFQKQGTLTIDASSVEDEDEEEENDDPPIQRGPGVRVLSSALSPAQVRPAITPESEVVQMMRIQHQWSAGIFAEMRASMEQQRLDMSAAMQSQSQSYGMLLNEVRDVMVEVRKDLHHARDEVNKANSRIVKMSEQTSAHFRGQQEANQQGWEAFRAGMQMQLQAMGQSMSWERQIMFMQFDQLAKEKSKSNSGPPSWVKDYGPLILAAVGQVLASKGSAQGEVLQELAMKAMEDDDPDGEEESEEAYSPSTPNGSAPKPDVTVMGMDTKTDPREHFEKNKLGSMLHLLDSMLKPEQKQNLKKLLPPMAWGTLQSALQSKNEALTKAYVIQFIAHVKQVEGLDDKLTSAMNEEQVELFNDIAEMITSGLPGGKKKKTKPPEKTQVIDVPATAAPTPPKTEPPPPPPAPPAPPPPPKPEAAGGSSASKTSKKKTSKKKTSKKKTSKKRTSKAGGE